MGAGSPTLGAWFVKAEPSLADVTGLSTALSAKCDDSRVLTDVPSGAHFTLPQIKILGSYVDFKQLDFQDCFVGAGSAPDEYGIIPSPQLQNVVGLSAALNGKVPSSSVLTNVPVNALFTDTVYTHPATHSIAEVSGLQTELDLLEEKTNAGKWEIGRHIAAGDTDG